MRRGCGEKETLPHCWWWWKLHPLCRTVFKFHKNNRATIWSIPFLSIDPQKTVIWKDACTPIFTAALFTIAKTWKQSEHPLTGKRIKTWYTYSSCSVTQSHPTICNPIDCSTPGFPVLHCLLEFAQTQVHWVSDAIQPSHPLSPPSPPALNLSQHQGLFQWVGSSHQVAKVLEFWLHH